MSDILIKRNHMEIPWHNYVSTRNSQPITEASLSEKASLIGRTGMMLLSCGTGAWRVRSSMNTLSEALGITCSADIGLMSISYTCFDGESSFSHALSLTTTGVNTSRLNRLEHFVSDFPAEGIHMSGEALHSQLDEIERIHGLYSPAALGLASALACGAFTSGRWPAGNDPGFCRRRHRKRHPLQAWQASFYSVYVHCSFCFLCLSCICKLPETGRASVPHFRPA